MLNYCRLKPWALVKRLWNLYKNTNIYFREMKVEMSSSKWRPLCSCFNVLTILYLTHGIHGSTFDIINPTARSLVSCGGHQYRSRLDATVRCSLSHGTRSKTPVTGIKQHDFRKLTRLTVTNSGKPATGTSSLYRKVIGKCIRDVVQERRKTSAKTRELHPFSATNPTCKKNPKTSS